MGEIAEMMLDGTLCEGCGEFLTDDPPGYPCRCSSCRNDVRRDSVTPRSKPKVYCPDCKKPVTRDGLWQHVSDVHKRTISPKEIDAAKPAKVDCPICKRKVNAAGLADHMRDAHQQKGAA